MRTKKRTQNPEHRRRDLECRMDRLSAIGDRRSAVSGESLSQERKDAKKRAQNSEHRRRDLEFRMDRLSAIGDRRSAVSRESLTQKREDARKEDLLLGGRPANRAKLRADPLFQCGGHRDPGGCGNAILLAAHAANSDRADQLAAHHQRHSALEGRSPWDF